VKNYNKVATSALCLWLLGSTALAAPQDVLQSPDEPMGQLEPDQILAPPPPKPAPVTPPAPPPEDITIDNASGISIAEARASTDSLGIASIKGLDRRLWEYLALDEALTLFTSIPDDLQPGVIRNTLIHMLLMQANAPRHSKGEWLYTRLDQLQRLGDVTSALALMQQVPASFRDPAFMERIATLQLQKGELLGACKSLADYIESNNNPLSDPLEHLRLYCMAKGGATSEVELALSIRNEAGTATPAWFVGLIESLQYDTTKIPAPDTELAALDLALLLSAGGKHWPDDLALSDYFHIRYLPYYGLIGRAPDFDLTTQITLLERAILSDRTLAPILAQRYQQLATSKSGDPAQRTRASGYNDMITGTASNKSFALMREAIRPIIQAGRIELAHALLRKPLLALTKNLQDNPPYHDYAPYSFAILLRAGDVQPASQWVRMMGLHRDNEPKTHIAYELTRFIESKAEVKSEEANTLPPYTIPDKTDENDLKMLRRYYRLMELFGYQVPSVTQQIADELLQENTTAQATPLIDSYATRGSLAGIILAAASLQSHHNLSQLDDGVLISIIQGLQKTGHDAIARQLAVESVLAFYQ